MYTRWNRVGGLLVVFIGNFLLLGCAKKDSLDYQVSLARVRKLVIKGVSERGLFIRENFEEPVSRSHIAELKKIPCYRKALSELLLEYCGGKDESQWGNPSRFFHICDLIEALGDKYFIDTLKSVIEKTCFIREEFRAKHLIKVLEGTATPRNE